MKEKCIESVPIGTRGVELLRRPYEATDNVFNLFGRQSTRFAECHTAKGRALRFRGRYWSWGNEFGSLTAAS
jgi:hypothetical protein